MGMSPKCDRCGRPAPECEPQCEIDGLREELASAGETYTEILNQQTAALREKVTALELQLAEEEKLKQGYYDEAAKGWGKFRAAELQIDEERKRADGFLERLRVEGEIAAATEKEIKGLRLQLSEAQERYAKLAEEWRITDPRNTIGPLWVSGWNEACHKIAESIRGRDDRVQSEKRKGLPCCGEDHVLLQGVPCPKQFRECAGCREAGAYCEAHRIG